MQLVFCSLRPLDLSHFIPSDIAVELEYLLHYVLQVNWHHLPRSVVFLKDFCRGVQILWPYIPSIALNVLRWELMLRRHYTGYIVSSIAIYDLTKYIQ